MQLRRTKLQKKTFMIKINVMNLIFLCVSEQEYKTMSPVEETDKLTDWYTKEYRMYQNIKNHHIVNV